MTSHARTAQKPANSVRVSRLTRFGACTSLVLALMFAGAPLAPRQEVAAMTRALTGVHVLGQGGFNQPSAVAVAGNHVWVANAEEATT